jgi:prepilin-type N-terminal cleavage/methylation domain-containing protein
MSENDAGFSLIESLVSLAVIATGMLGVATLFVVGTGLQISARDSTTTTQLAVAEVERIRMLPTTAPERANGGSLTANVANHFVVRGTTTLRWVIANGPACGPVVWAGPVAPVECTRVITVVGIPRNRRSMSPQVVTQLWR